MAAKILVSHLALPNAGGFDRVRQPGSGDNFLRPQECGIRRNTLEVKLQIPRGGRNEEAVHSFLLASSDERLCPGDIVESRVIS